MGLLELSTSFLYMNFALLKCRNYVKIQVQNDISPQGKISGLMAFAILYEKLFVVCANVKEFF